MKWTVVLLATLISADSIKISHSHSDASASIKVLVSAKKILKKLFYNIFLPGVKLGNYLTGRKTHCKLCKLTTGFVRHFVSGERSKKHLRSFVLWTCKHFKIESDNVCEGFVMEYEDWLFYILEKSMMSNTDICTLLLHPNCGSPDDLMKFTVKETDVPKPPVKPLPLPNRNAPTLKALHLSDVHIDLEYAVGSNAECEQPLCCHNDSTPSGSAKAGRWGSFGACDLPLESFESALKYIRDNVKVDYAIWTGDIVPHKVWSLSRHNNIDLIISFYSLFKKYLPDLPIYPTLGNHESVPANSFPTDHITGSYSVEWLYNTTVKLWSLWLPPSASATIVKGGYYVDRTAFPGLRIISLNMNYCNNLNWWILIDPTDPQDQLNWLVEELQDAENSGDKVHIIGHIPPGSGNCFSVWSDNYNKIVNRYESTIQAQFFGHTHQDEFEIFYDESNKTRPFSVAQIGPSVTTFNSGNPAFRVYTIDGNYSNSTWTVLDHETYYMNLTQANLDPNKDPVWNKGYSIKKKFGLKSLTPDDYNEFVHTLRVNNKAFRKFFRYYSKLDPSKQHYSLKTKQELLCKLVTSRSRDLRACKKTPLQRLKSTSVKNI